MSMYSIKTNKSCTYFVRCFYIFMSLLLSVGFDVDSTIDLDTFWLIRKISSAHQGCFVYLKRQILAVIFQHVFQIC